MSGSPKPAIVVYATGYRNNEINVKMLHWHYGAIIISIIHSYGYMYCDFCTPCACKPPRVTACPTATLTAQVKTGRPKRKRARRARFGSVECGSSNTSCRNHLDVKSYTNQWSNQTNNHPHGRVAGARRVRLTDLTPLHE
jgi:hypothetical protein